MSDLKKDAPQAARNVVANGDHDGAKRIIPDPAAAVVVPDTRLDPELNLLIGDHATRSRSVVHLGATQYGVVREEAPLFLFNEGVGLDCEQF